MNYVKTLAWVTAEKIQLVGKQTMLFVKDTTCLPTSYVFLGRKHKLKQKSQTQTELDDMHFLTVYKWVECIRLVLFTHNFEKIKSVCDKNGKFSGKCW